VTACFKTMHQLFITLVTEKYQHLLHYSSQKDVKQDRIYNTKRHATS